VADEGTATCVRFSGEIDSGCDDALSDALRQVSSAHPSAVIADLTEVTFMGSTGLGFIAHLLRLAQAGGGTVTIRNPPPQVSRLLDIVGLAGVVPIVGIEDPGDGRAPP
jgi:anti-anti-sigma factor